MGNRTYLTALSEKIICPGYRDDFRGETQTIGETAWHLPLPWLAMFREEDLVEDTYSNGKEEEEAIAPITTRDRAIANLGTAFLPLRSALGAVPELELYLRLMVEELETFQLRFVTIDWAEMDEPAAHEYFVRKWHDALRGFTDPKSVETLRPPSLFERLGAALGRPRPHPWLRALNAFTEFDPAQKLPSASAYLDGQELSREEDKLHAYLLPGNGEQRSVWMPPA